MVRFTAPLAAAWMASTSLAWACDMACVDARTTPFSAENLAPALADLVPSRTKVVWLDDNRLAYARPVQGDTRITLVDVRRPKQKTSELASRLAARGGLKPSAAAVRQARIVSASGRGVVLEIAGQALLYSPSSGQAEAIASAPSVAVSPAGQWRVRTLNNDLYADRPNGSLRLSSDGETWRSFAAAMSETQPSDRPVTEGRADAAAPRVGWIGDGPKFFIQRQDLRQTGELWMVDSLVTPRPRLITQKYPLPGETQLPSSELWVFDAQTGDAKLIDTGGWAHVGNLDPGAGGIWPSTDGETLFFARMSRGYQRVQLCAADLRTGEVRVLVDEHWPDGSTIRMTEFAQLGSGFIWKTEIDGYAHYARYDAGGRFIADLTPGKVSVRELLRIDEEAGELIYRSYDDAEKRNPAQSRLYAAKLSGAGVEPLDGEDADHNITLSPTGRYWTDVISRADLAPTLLLRSRTSSTVLETSNLDRLNKTGWRAPERVRLLAADGRTPLYGAYWAPANLPSGVRAPIVAEVYPGPSGEISPTTFEPLAAAGTMAQLGMGVLSIGQRGGMPGRGREYYGHVRKSGSVRDYPIADNMAALRALAQSHAELDIDRVGIIGHSGGGLMAATAILLEPKFYKAAVASSGNHDNNLYEMGSGEFHFGSPNAPPLGGPAGFAVNQSLASQLEGKLLLIHGDLDEDVPLGSSLRLARALIDAGKSFDTLIVPGSGHGFAGADRHYVRLRSWAYLYENLGAESTEPPEAKPSANAVK